MNTLLPTGTLETDAEAWFDNDESWFVSRSVSRRMERGRNCAMQQLALLETEIAKEKERLNWILNTKAVLEGDGSGWIVVSRTGCVLSRGDTEREAIDDARNNEGSE